MKVYVIEEESDDIYPMHRIGSCNPYSVDLMLNGQQLSMEINTGASRTVIGEDTFKKL